VTEAFNAGCGYPAAQNTGWTFNAAVSALLGFDGALTPIVTGLGKPAGEAFLAAPEASTWTMMVLGFEGIVLVGCRRKRSLALRRA
jgi:hypothetical protein